MPNATILKIFPPKTARKGGLYRRITFTLPDGSWAKTDVCPNFRNYERWKPVILAGAGTKVKGLVFNTPEEVNADSPVEIVREEVEV